MPSCTSKGCSRTPTWKGTVALPTSPRSPLDVTYCAICLTSMEAKAAKSEIILEFWPIGDPPELESPVHRAYRVENFGGGTSFKIVHESCGGVLMVTADVSIETLILLPIKHRAEHGCLLD